MIKALRINLKSKGTLETKSSPTGSIIYDNEIATLFRTSKNPRKKWHLITDEDSERLRQIVWTEIILKPSKILYLMEMELKHTENGRSTLCVFSNNFKIMNEKDFLTLLTLTAIKNSWPKESHSWKTKKEKEKADAYFKNYNHISIRHPSFNSKSKNNKLADDDITSWAKQYYSAIKEISKT